MALTDGSAAVTSRSTYDPYGDTTHQWLAPGPDNPFRFAGEYHDTATGLYKIGHRYYQPNLGRWTQRDPLDHRINPAQPAEHNPYAYVGCNPTNNTDPSGAISSDLGWTIAGCVAIGTLGVLGTVGTVGGFAPFAVGIISSCAIDLGLYALDPYIGSYLARMGSAGAGLWIALRVTAGAT